jgi:hypothetical protein
MNETGDTMLAPSLNPLAAPDADLTLITVEVAVV